MPRLITQAVFADFRSRVCEVASELFIELGHDGFNMRELAKRLRVSPMTVYRYFENKDEILEALRARAFARFADRLEIAQAMSGLAPEQSAAMGRAYVQFALEEPANYRLIFDLFQPRNHVFPELAQQERRAHTVVTEHARLLVDEGIFKGEPELIGQVLWSVLHGVVALHLAGRLDGSKFDQVLAETMRVLVSAYCSAIPLPTSPSDKWLTLVANDKQVPTPSDSSSVTFPAE